MPIKSYIAYPLPGRKTEAEAGLNRLPGCEATAADNEELLILVTDTSDEESEKALEAELSAFPLVQGMALVSAADPDLVEIQTTEGVQR